MAPELPVESDLEQLYQQFCVNLTQAQTLDEGIEFCHALLEAGFAPHACGLIWDSGRGPTCYGANLPMPTLGELDSLARGDIVIRQSDEQIAYCFAPLRARAKLLGWLAIEQPVWCGESPDLLATIAAQAGPALALLEVSVRQEERLQQLQTLNESGRLLSSVLDLDTLLEVICSTTRRLVDVQIFNIAFYDESTDSFQMAYLNIDGQHELAQVQWNAAAGLAGMVIRQRQPIRTQNYNAELQRRGVRPFPFETPRITAWMGLPLIAHDRPLGVMTLGSTREDYAYSNEQLDLLVTIAAQAAIAIDNARLYQRSEQQARQLSTLNHIGRTINSSLDPQRVPSLIMGQVCDLLNVEEGSLMLIDDQSGDLVFTYTTGPYGNRLLGQRLPGGVGLAGYVVSHGSAVIANDVQHDRRFYSATDIETGFITRAILAVPLRGMSGIQGVIEVMNKRNGAPFTLEDQRLLEAVADQAVIAIDNAERFSQVDQALARRAQELARTNDLLQHNLRSLTALNALGMAINTTLRDTSEIFAMTTRGVMEMTTALGACVLLPSDQVFQPTVQIGVSPTIAHYMPELLHTVLKTGRTAVIDHDLPTPLTDQGIHALLCVPLRATQHMLGVLCVYYAHEAPTASDQETAVLFGTQAAVAVESMQLFTAVRDAHDHMASVLASTREGIMLIEADQRVAIANDALYQLCDLPIDTACNHGIEQFLHEWEHAAAYQPEEWLALRAGLAAVLNNQQPFVFGELNQLGPHPRSVAWNAVQVRADQHKSSGALLVLRDITEAKDSERLRQDLTNMIVHDLRSPLSSVMASIDMLIRGISGEMNQPQLNVLNIAYSSSLQMLEMINTLLDISRLESGRMPLRPTTIDVRPLAKRAIERLTSLAHERAMVVQTDFPSDLALAHADEDLILRVLQNLLGNALNFSGRGSTVLIHACNGMPRHQSVGGGSASAPQHTDAQQVITLAVSDRGVGIAPKDQEKIFAKFSQVGERRGGTGLGLTFCKLVVETHGGNIWVESTLGEGSTFYFTLPINS